MKISFFYSLSVHRVADPGYRMAGLLHSSDMTREMIFDLGPMIRQRLKLSECRISDLSSAVAGYEGDLAVLAVRVNNLEADTLSISISAVPSRSQLTF